MEDERLIDAKAPDINVLYHSLRFRFLFWISVILLLTLGGAAYYVYSAQQGLLADSLRSKADAIGHFIALISPEPIYTFDITTLDRYMSQISDDPDVRFAMIRSPDGLPMTTYLPPDIKKGQLGKWIEQLDSDGSIVVDPVDPVKTYSFPIVDNGTDLGRVVVGIDTSRIISKSRQVVFDLVKIFSAIVLSLSGLIFIIFKLHVLNPVGALKNAAIRIADGNFSHQVPVYSHDELGHLARCFNTMMDEINIDREALISANRRLAEEISQRQLANRELTKLSLAVEQSPASVVITDLNGHIEYVNPKFCEVTGYSQDEVIGRKSHVFGAESDNPGELEHIWEKLAKGEIWKGEFRNRRKNGMIYWESAVIAPIRDSDGVTTHYLAVKVDITERKAFEHKLLEQATHDQLTGLPNRFLAVDRLQQMLQNAERRKNHIGIIYIDLDNFKTVNDSLGHAVGDDLLVQVSTRIWSHLRDEDTLCRLGGDEFMALIPNLQHPVEDLKIILHRIISSLQTPFDLSGHEVSVTSSLGIALFPEDGARVGSLMSNADMAMYEAKRAGRNTFRFFTREMNQKVQDKMTLETRLRHALDANELYPVYHPIIRLSDGALVGAETLLRWQSPELGNVTPSEFIPIAEQSGLIRPITEWLFDTILKHAVNWNQRPESLWIGVNVPPNYFCEEAFRHTIEATSNKARELDLDLCVEITENLFLQISEATLEQFKHLAELGVSSAMDDFGTGYSSLAYIKRFPLNHLKIDRTFVDGLPGESDDRSLTETIVLMGHRLGITLIAEGVENQAQLDYLKDLGVEYAQGFHIAKPMPHDEFKRYLSSLDESAPSQLSSAGQ
jgi:diguanylate cyclase (GGDEF)-like protein/PAS domain S-box-containing protein